MQHPVACKTSRPRASSLRCRTHRAVVSPTPRARRMLAMRQAARHRCHTCLSRTCVAPAVSARGDSAACPLARPLAHAQEGAIGEGVASQDAAARLDNATGEVGPGAGGVADAGLRMGRGARVQDVKRLFCSRHRRAGDVDVRNARCVCVSVSLCVGVRACVRVCVRVCTRVPSSRPEFRCRVLSACARRTLCMVHSDLTSYIGTQ